MNYVRRYWCHTDITPVLWDVHGRGSAIKRLAVRPKPEVPTRNEKEKRAESAAHTVRRQETPSAPPPRKARKCDNYVDDVARVADGTGHLLEVPRMSCSGRL